MKKLISLLILFSLIFTGTDSFALSVREDVTLSCGLSEEELALGLLGELRSLAPEFISAEEKYSVNAVFLAAVAALESGWGKFCFRPNNIFGWSGKNFDSKEECIDFVASKIAEHYLSEDGKYYNGKTVAGVNICYNGNAFWERKVLDIMAMIEKNAKEKPPLKFAEKAADFSVVFIG